MSNTLILSILQHQPTPGSVNSCLSRLDHYAALAHKDDSALLVVPEASMTGYNIPLTLRNNVAQTLDGELTDRVAVLCRKHQIAISYGFIEQCDAMFFNTVQLIDSSGQPVSHYRKTHLWGELDRSLFSPGESFSPVVDLDSWKIGHLICYDVEFPETVRHLALQGAELILVPTALMSPYSMVADLVVPARAYESQVFVAYTNYCGQENGMEYVGHSCITGPDGIDLAKADAEPVMLTVTLDKASIDTARSVLPYHRDRRPELYTLLNKTDLND